jgi:hypothetical protein
MEITIDEIQMSLPEAAEEAVVLLPVGFMSDAKRTEYHSTAISFCKFARNAMPVQFASEPLTVLEQRSGDWFVPAMAITGQVINDHPVIVSVICGVIANYITAFMVSTNKPQVHVELVIEKTRGQTFVKVSYKGNVDDMQAAIENAVASARGDNADA